MNRVDTTKAVAHPLQVRMDLLVSEVLSLPMQIDANDSPNYRGNLAAQMSLNG